MTANQPIDVSILVVSYNTVEMTRAALDSLADGAQNVRYEVIAVDNASSDGSAGMLSTHPEVTTLIARTDNLGFAAANNLAAKSARGDYLLLLNPDTIVLDGAIGQLVAFAKARPSARIWGGRTLFAGGSLNIASCWGRMTPWNQLCRATGLTGLFRNTELFNGEAYGGWQRDTIRDVDIVSGCFLLIKRDFWNSLGGFDPLFFMYGEEADLCLRAHAFGAKPAITPAATIIHHCGASEKARAGKMVRLLAAKASLIKRHWTPATVPLGLLLLASWPLSRTVALRILSIFKSSPSTRESADAWLEIWQRRKEWWQGYDAAAPDSQNPLAAAAHQVAPS